MRVGKGPQKSKATKKKQDAPTPAGSKLRVGVPADRKPRPVAEPTPVIPDNRSDFDSTGKPTTDDGSWRTSKYDYASLGLRWTGREAVCVYGCGGTTANVSGLCYHRWDCVYWDREGKDRTPF